MLLMMRQMASCECKSQDWQLAYSWFGQMKVSWFWLQNRQSCDKAIRVASRYRTTDRQFLFYCFGDMLGQPFVQTETSYSRLHVCDSRSEIPQSCRWQFGLSHVRLSLVWRVGRYTFRNLHWHCDKSLCGESRLDRMGNWAFKKSPNEHQSNSHSVRSLIGRNELGLQWSTRKRSEFEVKVRPFQETQKWEVEVRQFCKSTEWELCSQAVNQVHVKSQGSSLRNDQTGKWEI